MQAFLLFNESKTSLNMDAVISAIDEQFAMRAVVSDTTDEDGVTEIELTLTTNEGDEGKATLQLATGGGRLRAFSDLQEEIAAQDPEIAEIFKRSTEDIAIIAMGEEPNAMAATLTAIAAAEICNSGVLLIDIPDDMLDEEAEENEDDPEAGMIQTAWFPTADDFADQFFGDDEEGCGDDCGCDDDEESEHHHH